MPLPTESVTYTVMTGEKPGIRYHSLQVIYVEPLGQVITTNPGPIGRGPVRFAGKCPQVLKQALAEANSPLKLY